MKPVQNKTGRGDTETAVAPLLCYSLGFQSVQTVRLYNAHSAQTTACVRHHNRQSEQRLRSVKFRSDVTMFIQHVCFHLADIKTSTVHTYPTPQCTLHTLANTYLTPQPQFNKTVKTCPTLQRSLCSTINTSRTRRKALLCTRLARTPQYPFCAK